LTGTALGKIKFRDHAAKTQDQGPTTQLHLCIKVANCVGSTYLLKMLWLSRYRLRFIRRRDIKLHIDSYRNSHFRTLLDMTSGRAVRSCRILRIRPFFTLGFSNQFSGKLFSHFLRMPAAVSAV
jgi:hypothetical protein